MAVDGTGGGVHLPHAMGDGSGSTDSLRDEDKITISEGGKTLQVTVKQLKQMAAGSSAERAQHLMKRIITYNTQMKAVSEEGTRSRVNIGADGARSITYVNKKNDVVTEKYEDASPALKAAMDCQADIIRIAKEVLGEQENIDDFVKSGSEPPTSPGDSAPTTLSGHDRTRTVGLSQPSLTLNSYIATPPHLRPSLSAGQRTFLNAQGAKHLESTATKMGIDATISDPIFGAPTDPAHGAKQKKVKDAMVKLMLASHNSSTAKEAARGELRKAYEELEGIATGTVTRRLAAFNEQFAKLQELVEVASHPIDVVDAVDRALTSSRATVSLKDKQALMANFPNVPDSVTFTAGNKAGLEKALKAIQKAGSPTLLSGSSVADRIEKHPNLSKVSVADPTASPPVTTAVPAGNTISKEKIASVIQSLKGKTPEEVESALKDIGKLFGVANLQAALGGDRMALRDVETFVKNEARMEVLMRDPQLKEKLSSPEALTLLAEDYAGRIGNVTVTFGNGESKARAYAQEILSLDPSNPSDRAQIEKIIYFVSQCKTEGDFAVAPAKSSGGVFDIDLSPPHTGQSLKDVRSAGTYDLMTPAQKEHAFATMLGTFKDIAHDKNLTDLAHQLLYSGLSPYKEVYEQMKAAFEEAMRNPSLDLTNEIKTIISSSSIPDPGKTNLGSIANGMTAIINTTLRNINVISSLHSGEGIADGYNLRQLSAAQIDKLSPQQRGSIDTELLQRLGSGTPHADDIRGVRGNNTLEFDTGMTRFREKIIERIKAGENQLGADDIASSFPELKAKIGNAAFATFVADMKAAYTDDYIFDALPNNTINSGSSLNTYQRRQVAGDLRRRLELASTAADKELQVIDGRLRDIDASIATLQAAQKSSRGDSVRQQIRARNQLLGKLDKEISALSKNTSLDAAEKTKLESLKKAREAVSDGIFDINTGKVDKGKFQAYQEAMSAASSTLHHDMAALIGEIQPSDVGSWIPNALLDDLNDEITRLKAEKKPDAAQKAKLKNLEAAKKAIENGYKGNETAFQAAAKALDAADPIKQAMEEYDRRASLLDGNADKPIPPLITHTGWSPAPNRKVGSMFHKLRTIESRFRKLPNTKSGSILELYSKTRRNIAANVADTARRLQEGILKPDGSVDQEKLHQIRQNIEELKKVAAVAHSSGDKDAEQLAGDVYSLITEMKKYLEDGDFMEAEYGFPIESEHTASVIEHLERQKDALVGQRSSIEAKRPNLEKFDEIAKGFVSSGQSLSEFRRALTTAADELGISKAELHKAMDEIEALGSPAATRDLTDAQKAQIFEKMKTGMTEIYTQADLSTVRAANARGGAYTIQPTDINASAVLSDPGVQKDLTELEGKFLSGEISYDDLMQQMQDIMSNAIIDAAGSITPPDAAIAIDPISLSSLVDSKTPPLVKEIEEMPLKGIEGAEGMRIEGEATPTTPLPEASAGSMLKSEAREIGSKLSSLERRAQLGVLTLMRIGDLSNSAITKALAKHVGANGALDLGALRAESQLLVALADQFEGLDPHSKEKIEGKLRQLQMIYAAQTNLESASERSDRDAVARIHDQVTQMEIDEGISSAEEARDLREARGKVRELQAQVAELSRADIPTLRANLDKAIIDYDARYDELEQRQANLAALKEQSAEMARTQEAHNTTIEHTQRALSIIARFDEKVKPKELELEEILAQSEALIAEHRAHASTMSPTDARTLRLRIARIDGLSRQLMSEIRALKEDVVHKLAAAAANSEGKLPPLIRAVFLTAPSFAEPFEKYREAVNSKHFKAQSAIEKFDRVNAQITSLGTSTELLEADLVRCKENLDAMKERLGAGEEGANFVQGSGTP